MARPSRQCGNCAVCCEVAAVPDLEKPALTRCQYQIDSDEGSCGIVGDPKRPMLCKVYTCAWLDGIGSDDDRPNEIGAMFSVNQTEQGIIGYAVETEPDAILTKARGMAVDYARRFKIPLIVVETTQSDGDLGRVIVHSDIEERASGIIGERVAALSDDVSMFKRKEPEWQPSQSRPQQQISND